MPRATRSIAIGLMAWSVAACGVISLPGSAQAMETCQAFALEIRDRDPSVVVVGAFDTDIARLRQLMRQGAERRKEPMLDAPIFDQSRDEHERAAVCYIDTLNAWTGGPSDPLARIVAASLYTNIDPWSGVIDFGQPGEIPVVAP